MAVKNITNNIVRSKSGYETMIFTQTVQTTIILLDMPTLSVQDVTYAINMNARKNEQVTEQKVAAYMKKLAKDMQSYRYYGMKKLINLDGYFFQYGK